LLHLFAWVDFQYQAELQQVIASDQEERLRLVRMLEQSDATTTPKRRQQQHQNRRGVVLRNHSRSNLFDSFDSEDDPLVETPGSTDRPSWRQQQTVVSSFDLNISSSEAKLKELHYRLATPSDSTARY
jgi:hypothetical protein